MDLLNSFVDYFELVGPVSGIGVRAHVVAVVIAALGVEVEGRGEGGGLVAIEPIVGKEPLYLGRQLLHVLVN